MSAIDYALTRLKTEEGFRGTMYPDSEGNPTVGYGFKISSGLTKDEAAALLAAQLQTRSEALLKFPWYAGLDEARQSVCLDIAYNDGLHGLLNFPHMISALAQKDWATAAVQCQVKNPELAGRYRLLSQILMTGTP